MQNLQTALLLIDSTDRIPINSVSSTNFVVILDQGYNIYEAELISASIPNCLYNVTNNNNSFNFSDTGGSHNIIIPIGIYNITQLCLYLQTQMNTFLTQTYTVSYNSSSNRVEFSVA